MSDAYSYSLALQTIAKYSPLVEIGAGSGYWASLLHQQGTDIIAYDDGSWAFKDRWFPVRVGSEFEILEHQDRTLFLCWPAKENPMAFNAANLFRGKYLIFVGEAKGGVTADDAFFDLLERDYQIVEQVKIPQWPGYSDVLTVYRRR